MTQPPDDRAKDEAHASDKHSAKTLTVRLSELQAPLPNSFALSGWLEPVRSVFAPDFYGECSTCTAFWSALLGNVDGAIRFCELTLPGWYWRVGRSSLYPGWASVNRVHPDHCSPRDEAFSEGASPSIALLAAALKAGQS